VPGGLEDAHTALDVRRRAVRLRVTSRRQHHVGLVDRLVAERVDGDDRPCPGQRALRKVVIAKVGQRIGTEQHQHVDATLGGRGEDAGRVETLAGGNGAPPLVEPLATVVEGDPPWQ
jgi:hypothetical protein